MATKIASIDCKNNHGSRDYLFNYFIRFYQHYTSADGKQVYGDLTLWTGKSYKNQAEFERDLANADALINDCRKELLKDAAEQAIKGYRVKNLVVSLNRRDGYEVEALDARHLRMVARKHKSPATPPAGKSRALPKAWNITQDPEYPKALEAAFQAEVGHLRGRTKHLERIRWEQDQQHIANEFSRVADVWLKHEKGLGRIEDFLNRLLSRKLFEAHRLCLDIWGQAVHTTPLRFFKLFDISHYDLMTISPKHQNLLLSATDSFESLNTLLALNPYVCFQGDQLLSDSWVKGLTVESRRDAALMALMSGYARYQRLILADRFKSTEDQPIESSELAGKQYFERLAASTNLPFQQILDMMPDFGSKPSDAVGAYYRAEVDRMQDYGRNDLRIPRAISNFMPLRYSTDILSLALKARLLSTKVHQEYAGNSFMREQDNEYFGMMIRDSNANLEQILAVVKPMLIHKENFTQLQERGLAEAYLDAMSQEERDHHIKKGHIHPSLLSNPMDRVTVLEVDLGL